MSVGRVLLIIFGSIFVLVAIGLLVGGSALLWFNAAAKDEEGFYTTRPQRFQTTTHAIVSEGVRIDVEPGDDGGGFTDWWFDPGTFATIRLSGSSKDPGKPIFLGIAREEDLTSYLSDVRYDEIRDLDFSPFRVDYTTHPGNSTPEPPTQQAFWRASASGTGTQMLTWDVEEGVWSAVVMNADGSPGIDVELRLGARAGFIFPTGLGLVIAGAVVLVGGSIMIYFGARTPPRR